MTGIISTSARIGVRQLAGAIGAELSGADTGGKLSDGAVAQIRQALLDHKVVFLRDQHLDYATQVAFAERLGPLTLGHPTLASPPEQPFLEEIDSAKGARANYWHTDVTFVDRPPAFTLLHAVVIPPVGGDTLWANTVAAYESLPAGLRDLADRLRVVHTNDDQAAVPGPDYRADDQVLERRAEFISTIYETEHPAVSVHPETGERSLLLGGFARAVVGFPPQASRDLIRLLQEHVIRPEHTVRWQWRRGDLAIWDNRATQHYAIFDYGTG
jgi:alpha-ketoglutarate-dependent taurine dioxygenase